MVPSRENGFLRLWDHGVSPVLLAACYTPSCSLRVLRVKKGSQEVEIKFSVNDARALTRALKQAGFAQQTKRTFESNILYDFPDRRLRKRGELIRVRQYGKEWTLTYKGKGNVGKHKCREEIETKIENGNAFELVLIRLGLTRSFAYEKYRSEWSDGTGHVVLDETPIGFFGEIEGSARWIDTTAKKLGISTRDYNTSSYADLFLQWKRRTRSRALDMTFAAIRSGR
jgi:adenylate cyclase, class 2